MSDRPTIRLAKFVAILGFLVLLSSTYFLRREALTMNQIRFSADQARSEHEINELKESHPDRIKQYEADKSQYQLELEHYRTMLELYKSDYEEYTKRLNRDFPYGLSLEPLQA